MVGVFEAKLLGHFLLAHARTVHVERVQDGQGLLRIAMARVRHPAARFHLNKDRSMANQ